MASSKIYQGARSIVGYIANSGFFGSRVLFLDRKIKFSEKNTKTTVVKNKKYGSASFKKQEIVVDVSQDLPFRVKFISIGIESYGPNNPPPIGIAIIGFNNYIL
jgi:hypothetical protein